MNEAVPNEYRGLELALAIPCLDEAISIETVIQDFRHNLPELAIHVFDNASTDETVKVAESAGAKVHRVLRRGKGNVVRRIFADIDADVIILVDGDATYDASAIREMVDMLIDQQLDMVVGCRDTAFDEAAKAYRKGHQFGNRMLTRTVAFLFGRSFTDMLSGYRVVSRRFAKSFPASSKGFEIETELAVHTLEMRMPAGELITKYKSRPEGSRSKLSTFRDGFKILGMIVSLCIAEKPLGFYAICATIFSAISVLLAIPLFVEYAQTGLVPRFPTAILCASLMVIALLSLSCGLILDNVKKARHDIRRLAYLSYPSVTSSRKPR